MANMKVGTRLALGFGAVITLMIIIAVVGLNSMRNINNELNDIVNDKFPKTVWANNMVAGINVIARSMRNALLLTDANLIQGQIENVNTQREIIKTNLAKLEEKITTAEGKAVLAKVIEARTLYVGHQDEFLKLMKDGKKEEAREYLLETIRKSQQAYIDSINVLINFQEDLMKKVGRRRGKQSGINCTHADYGLGADCRDRRYYHRDDHREKPDEAIGWRARLRG